MLVYVPFRMLLFFLFTDPAPTLLSTLSLHDALPILFDGGVRGHTYRLGFAGGERRLAAGVATALYRGAPGSSGTGWDVGLVYDRSEEHTSELQSRFDLVCRLLLEKKKHNHLCL